MGFKVEGSVSGVSADVDTSTKALLVKPLGTATVTFDATETYIDSFNRLRTSAPRILFEYSFANDAVASIWEATAYGAGTKTANTTVFQTELNTTTAANTGYWIQSWYQTRYAPGISTLTRFTFCFNNLITNVVQRAGIFTDQGTFPSTAGDGIYIEADGASVSIVRRYLTGGGSGAEERVGQGAWSIDQMDGTGPSGVTTDWTKAQHLVIEYQWLGVGSVNVGFETGSGVIWVHTFTNVNVTSVAWSRTGTYPVRAEIYTRSALAVAGKLSLINVVVIQEGDVEMRGWRYRSGDSGATIRTGGTAVGLYPLMAIRTAITNDVTKRATVIPVRATIAITTAPTTTVACKWALVWGPTTLTGATFAVAASDAVTVDNAATAATAIAGGIIIASGTFLPTAQLITIDLTPYQDSLLRIAQNAAGGLTTTGNAVLCLAAGPMVTAAGAGMSASATLDWKEIL